MFRKETAANSVQCGLAVEKEGRAWAGAGGSAGVKTCLTGLQGEQTERNESW